MAFAARAGYRSSELIFVKRLLIAGLKQETSCFNPVLTRYDRFQIRSGDDMLRSLSGTNTEIAGAADVFSAHSDLDVLPAWTAWSGSGGPIDQRDLDRLSKELLEAVRSVAGADGSGVDGAYIAFHGAMAGVGESDPEGAVLQEIRDLLGERPVVGP